MGSIGYYVPGVNGAPGRYEYRTVSDIPAPSKTPQTAYNGAIRTETVNNRNGTTDSYFYTPAQHYDFKTGTYSYVQEPAQTGALTSGQSRNGGYAGLGKGSSRTDVSSFQNDYNRNYGGNLAVDGIYGPKTNAAYGDYIKQVQQQAQQDAFAQAQREAQELANRNNAYPYPYNYGVAAPGAAGPVSAAGYTPIRNPGFNEAEARARAYAMYEPSYKARTEQIAQARNQNVQSMYDEMARRGMGRSSLLLEQEAELNKYYDGEITDASNEFTAAANGYLADLTAGYRQDQLQVELFNAQMAAQAANRQREQARWQAEFGLTMDEFIHRQALAAIAAEQEYAAAKRRGA